MYGRIFCFVNCHFAAHLEAVSRRNADFDYVYRTMVFSRPSGSLNTAAGMIITCYSLACSHTRYTCFGFVIAYACPWSCVAAGVSTAVQVVRNANVCVR